MLKVLPANFNDTSRVQGLSTHKQVTVCCLLLAPKSRHMGSLRTFQDSSTLGDIPQEQVSRNSGLSSRSCPSPALRCPQVLNILKHSPMLGEQWPPMLQ